MEAESSTIGALRNTRKRRKVSSVALESSKPEKTLEVAVTEPKKAKPTRKKIGKLNNLPSMPLDILFEILGHLKPYDLLKLARTTKDFRRLLMNKSSISVWKASLGEVSGLPPCPPQMNEPAWTNLVFSPQCHYCLATTRIVEWRFRMRICKGCSKTLLGNLRNRLFRAAYFSDGDQPESIEDRFENLPLMSLIANRPGKRGVAIYLLSDYDELENQYKVVLQTDEERAAYISQRKALIEEIYKHASLCEAWMKTQVEDRDTELRQLREDRRVAIIKKLQDLGWGEEIEAIRYPDYFANHKLVDRPQRLTERIWSNMKNELVEYMQQMRVKRLKREFDALVLKRKGIAAQFLRAYRNARVNEGEIIPEGPDFCTFEPVQEIYRQPVEVEVTVDSFTSVIPLLPDLLAAWRRKLDDSLTLRLKMGPPRRLALEEMMNLDLDLCWVDEDGEVCSRTVAKPGPFEGMTDEQVMEKLKLATTAFICKACSLQRSHFEDTCYDLWYDSDESVDDSNSKILFYPQVLSHACLTRTVIMDWDWDYFHATEDPVANLNGGMSKKCLWSDAKLSVDVHAGNIVEEIVKLAGLDPATATPHDMDELDLRFACLRCSKVANASGSQSDSDGPETITTLPNASGSQSNSDEPEMITTLPLMKWRKAVKHYKDGHAYLNKHLPNHFMKVDGTRLNDSVKAAEREYRTKWDALWQCMHCRDTPAEKKPGTLREVEEHVNISHDTASPVLNKDYCKHPNHLDIESGGPLFLVNYDAGGFSLASRQPADSPIN